MAFFDFFRSKKRKSQNPESPAEDEKSSGPVNINADNFVDPQLHTIQNVASEDVEDSKYTKIIHQFLNRDFESIGYNDALVNPESKYKEDNIKILQSDYLILLNEAQYAFKDYLKELESYVETSKKAGLDDTIKRLEARKETINERLEFVAGQRIEIRDNTGAASRIGLSYSRGFSRGLTVLIESKIIKKV